MPDSELTTEQWVENLRAAVLDIYNQLDRTRNRLDFHYGRIRALEDNPLPEPGGQSLLVDRVAARMPRLGGETVDMQAHYARCAMLDVANALVDSGHRSASAWLMKQLEEDCHP